MNISVICMHFFIENILHSNGLLKTQKNNSFYPWYVWNFPVRNRDAQRLMHKKLAKGIVLFLKLLSYVYIKTI